MKGGSPAIEAMPPAINSVAPDVSSASPIGIRLASRMITGHSMLL